MLKKKIFGMMTVLAAAMLVFAAGCGDTESGSTGNGSTGGVGGLNYWEQWEATAQSGGYTKGWPDITNYTLSLSNPGGDTVCYYKQTIVNGDDWTDKGYRDYLQYELELQIGYATINLFDALKQQIENSTGWDAVTDSYFETTAEDELGYKLGTALIMSITFDPALVGNGPDTRITITAKFKEYIN